MTSNPSNELDSAVECLQEIAALKGTSKRQKVNCELAINWLVRHGYPLGAGFYRPGQGFRDADNASGLSASKDGYPQG